MEAAGEQDEAVCVCAENRRKKAHTKTCVCVASDGGAPVGIVKSPFD